MFFLSSKILVVDDEEQIVDLVKTFLEREGYSVIEAYSGEEGLKKAFDESPDLILLDIMMPVIDGWEVFRRLRNEPDTKSIKVVFLTARNQNIDRMIGLSVMKAEGYITKPFSRNSLIETVSDVLGGK